MPLIERSKTGQSENKKIKKQDSQKTRRLKTGQPENKKIGKQDSQKTRRLENRTARKQEDWKNDYLHSALNTCINKFVL